MFGEVIQGQEILKLISKHHHGTKKDGELLWEFIEVTNCGEITPEDTELPY